MQHAQLGQDVTRVLPKPCLGFANWMSPNKGLEFDDQCDICWSQYNGGIDLDR